MSKLLDYLDWRGDLSFDNSPENEIDAVLLSQLAILPLETIVKKPVSIKEMGSAYLKNKLYEIDLGVMMPSLLHECVEKIYVSNRFCNFTVKDYINKIDESIPMQIAAMTVENDSLRYVVFAGTSDTLADWQENVDMSYKAPTESQKEAIAYLEEHSDTDKKLIVCGHSKGGNLAIYSTLYCNEKTKDKIYKTYCIDGPGCAEEDFKGNPAVKKIFSLFPECSIVGRLFEHCEHYEIVKCHREGYYQHDCFNWEILGAQFVRGEKFTTESDEINQLMKGLIASMTEEEKKSFSNSLFHVLQGTESKTLTEVLENKSKLFGEYFKLGKDSRKALFSVGLKMWRNNSSRKIFMKNIFTFLKERKQKK